MNRQSESAPMNQLNQPRQGISPQRSTDGTRPQAQRPIAPGGYVRDIPPRRISQEEREEEENDIREPRPHGEVIDVPLTKTGTPDRRFLGARHLPPPDIANPEFRRARVGGVIDDTHVTLDGKPDRRFKENRGLDDEETMRQWAQVLSSRYLQH